VKGLHLTDSLVDNAPRDAEEGGDDQWHPGDEKVFRQVDLVRDSDGAVGHDKEGSGGVDDRSGWFNVDMGCGAGG
jgi:hypothetical protein